MSSDANSSNQPPAVKVVGGYEVIRRIGQGGMGSVFLARQISMNRPVALKILAPHLAKDKVYVERFLREARAAARLSHPNIVQAYDVGNAAGYFYFAMEYVDGVTLKKQMQQSNSPIPEKQALEIVRDIADALRHAHAAKIVHRDVKPENILLAADGTPKLADLGIARDKLSNDSHLTQGAAIGTPLYISPEQARGESDIDGRADVYSLGATLYHILTGQTPYTGGTSAEVISKHLTAPLPDPRKVNPKISRAASAIVMKAMAKNKINRFPSAAAMAEEVSAALSTAPQVKVPEPLKARRRKAEKSSPGLLIAAAIFLIACVAGAGIFLAARDSKTDEPPVQGDIQVPPQTEPVTPKPPPASRTDGQRVQREAEIFGQELIGRMTEAASRGDYDAAIKMKGEVPPQYSGIIGQRIDFVVNRLDARAREVIQSAVNDVNSMLENGRLEDAERLFDMVRPIRFSPLAGLVNETEAKLVAARDRANPADSDTPPVDVTENHNVEMALAKNAQFHQAFIDVVHKAKKDNLRETGKKYLEIFNQRIDRINELKTTLKQVEGRQGRAGAALREERIKKIKGEIEHLEQENQILAAQANQYKQMVETRVEDALSRLRGAFEKLNEQINHGQFPGDDVLKDAYVRALQATK